MCRCRWSVVEKNAEAAPQAISTTSGYQFALIHLKPAQPIFVAIYGLETAFSPSGSCCSIKCHCPCTFNIVFSGRVVSDNRNFLLQFVLGIDYFVLYKCDLYILGSRGSMYQAGVFASI